MTSASHCPVCGAAIDAAESNGNEIRCDRCGSDIEVDEQTPASPPRAPHDLYAPEKDSTRAIVAILLGLVAAISWPCPPAGLIAGGLAILFGARGLAARQRQLAIAGIVLGLSGMIFSLGCGVLYGVAIDQEERINDRSGNRPPFTQ